jgi:hypothetical protein
MFLIMGYRKLLTDEKSSTPTVWNVSHYFLNSTLVGADRTSIHHMNVLKIATPKSEDMTWKILQRTRLGKTSDEWPRLGRTRQGWARRLGKTGQDLKRLGKT